MAHLLRYDIKDTLGSLCSLGMTAVYVISTKDFSPHGEILKDTLNAFAYAQLLRYDIRSLDYARDDTREGFKMTLMGLLFIFVTLKRVD